MLETFEALIAFFTLLLAFVEALITSRTFYLITKHIGSEKCYQRKRVRETNFLLRIRLQTRVNASARNLRLIDWFCRDMPIAICVHLHKAAELAAATQLVILIRESPCGNTSRPKERELGSEPSSFALTLFARVYPVASCCVHYIHWPSVVQDN